MTTVVLIIHLIIAASLVGIVLLQRSEGGGLGMGGGGGFMTGRGQANFMTRATAMLAAAFFVTSITLTLLAQRTAPAGSVFDRSGGPAAVAPAPGAPAQPGAPGSTPAPAAPSQGGGGILDKLQSPSPVPQDQ